MESFLNRVRVCKSRRMVDRYRWYIHDDTSVPMNISCPKSVPWGMRRSCARNWNRRRKTEMWMR